jgi:hypothetical protein
MLPRLIGPPTWKFHWGGKKYEVSTLAICECVTDSERNSTTCSAIAYYHFLRVKSDKRSSLLRNAGHCLSCRRHAPRTRVRARGKKYLYRKAPATTGRFSERAQCLSIVGKEALQLKQWRYHRHPDHQVQNATCAEKRGGCLAKKQLKSGVSGRLGEDHRYSRSVTILNIDALLHTSSPASSMPSFHQPKV